MSNTNIAFIGDRETIIGFKIIGADIFAVHNSKEFLNIFYEMELEKYSTIFVTEDVIKDIVEKVEVLQKQIAPSLTVIPKRFLKLNIGETILKRNVRKAIGTDIL